jgi:glycosyltransferase involved in cell wall biosynthesis
MWCRIALKYPIAFSTYAGAVYHQEADNRVRHGRPILAEPRIVRTLENALAAGKFPDGVTRADLVEYVNIQLITRAQSIARHGYLKEARDLLRKASATQLHRGVLRRWLLLSYLPAPSVRLVFNVRESMVSLRSRASTGRYHGSRSYAEPGDRRWGGPCQGTSGQRLDDRLQPPIAGASAVSVVIPLYNKVRHVGRALDSVLAQTYRDFEVIVVNDGSSDGSADVVGRYSDPRIRLVHQENAGVSAARNRGIAEARADLIAFLDADDEWLPEHLETVLRLRQNYPQCGAYATAFRIVASRGRITPSFAGIPAASYEGVIPNYFRTVRGDHAVWTSAVAVRRDTFNDCGLFPVGEQRREDLDMWCRIALKYPIAFSTHAGAIYHQEADNRLGNGPPVLTEPQVVHTLEGALATGEFPNGVERSDLVEYVNIQLITRAQSIARHGYLKEARDLLRKASATRLHRRVLRRWLFLSRLPTPFVRLALDVRQYTVSAFGRASGGRHHQG